MSELRVAARTLGPGGPGVLRVLLTQDGKEPPASLLRVPVDRLPVELRMPNATFVAVVSRGQFVRVEPLGPAWLTYQDRMREVLERDWDPIGVFPVEGSGADVAGEYDDYIAELHALLMAGASERQVAGHLREIERTKMGLGETPMQRRLDVAARLRAIDRLWADG